MTVATTTSRVEYSGNAVTLAFSVPFYFLANGDLKVFLAGVLQTLTTHYSVSGAGNPAGGTVTFVAAPGSGAAVVVLRDPAVLQETDYAPNDPFPAESHERALDKLTMIAQRLTERAGRSAALPDGYVGGASPSLPVPGAGQYLRWNVAGTALEAVSTSPDLSTFTQSGAGAVARSWTSKVGEIVSVKDFGAVGDGLVDDTVAIHAAFAAAEGVTFPAGTYLTSGLTINPGHLVKQIIGVGAATIKLTAAASARALTVQKPFVVIDGMDFTTTGTSNDGLGTSGIYALSLAYFTIKNARFTTFSGINIDCVQGVYWGLENITINGGTRGLSFSPDGAIPTTTVTVNGAYISGCTRGVFQGGCAQMEYSGVIVEYCGDAVSVDGAFHLINSSSTVLISCYWEANYRNIVAVDAQFALISDYRLAATAADSITWVGTAFSERGTYLLRPWELQIKSIQADALSNTDLAIGTNLTVPIAGGSVQYGNETRSVASGTLTSATWTTVAAIPAADYGSSVNLNAFYEYVCYSGAADLSTGFDAGTLMNGTLRSYSGSLPAWLRFDSGNIQMNVTSSSYGLNYKIVLRRVYPG
jgi:hypothetical protein